MRMMGYAQQQHLCLCHCVTVSWSALFPAMRALYLCATLLLSSLAGAATRKLLLSVSDTLLLLGMLHSMPKR